jgi:hypothetical protein
LDRLRKTNLTATAAAAALSPRMASMECDFRNWKLDSIDDPFNDDSNIENLASISDDVFDASSVGVRASKVVFVDSDDELLWLPLDVVELRRRFNKNFFLIRH